MAAPQNIDEALAQFQKDLPTLVKDKSGQVGNQKTKYADLAQANEVVLKRLNDLGVIYVCKPTLRADDPKFVLSYRLTHVASSTSEEGDYPLKLSDNPMQMGSAITYARRYALLAVTGVVSEDEDDDGRAAANQRYAQRSNRQQAAAPAAEGRTAQRAQRPAGARPALPGEGSSATTAQMQKLAIQFGEMGVDDRGERLDLCSRFAGRELGSAKDLTGQQASALIDLAEKALTEDAPLAWLTEQIGTERAAAGAS